VQSAPNSEKAFEAIISEEQVQNGNGVAEEVVSE